MPMMIFDIYPAIDVEEPICRTMAEGPEEALALTRQNAWAEQRMTKTAYAERVEE